MCNSYFLNTNLCPIVRSVKRSGKKPLKAESGQHFLLRSPNPRNPNVYSYRKVAKTAVKAERRKRSTRKLRPLKRVAKKLKPSRKTMVKQMKRAAKQANKNNNDNQNNGIQNRINRDLERARKEVADANRYLPHKHQYRVQARGLEDEGELSRRDLDAGEVFGREYDLLGERDTFDDLD